MRVEVSVVGEHPRPEVTWPEGWPVPPEDALVEVNGNPLWVRSVTWYPYGEDGDREPFVYMVLGPRRPS